MKKLINKLLLTLVLFSYAGHTKTENSIYPTLEESFYLAKAQILEYPASFLITWNNITKIEPDSLFPGDVVEGIIIQGTSRQIIAKNGHFSFYFDPAIGPRMGLRQLVQSLYSDSDIMMRQKRICDLLGQISRDYIEYKKNERGNKNYYVQIESKDEELFGKISADPQNAYGALFKESGEWYFDEFKQGLHNLKLNQCLQTLIMQLEIIGDKNTKMISSQFKRKPVSEFLTQYAMDLAKSKGFVVIINDRNFSTLATEYIQSYKPLVESNNNILIYTKENPEHMKAGEEYKMMYYFVSNDANPNLSKYLDAAKERFKKHKYKVAFLERVKKLVTESSRFYFKISRDGPYCNIVECPTADAHGSCTINRNSMTVNWFYDGPDAWCKTEDDSKAAWHEIEKAFIAYYNRKTINDTEPTILHSKPYCMDEEPAFKRRKLH